MRFEELASKAGKRAATIGSEADRPLFGRLLARRRRRTVVSVWSIGAIVGLAMLGAILSRPWLGADVPTAVPAPTTTQAGAIPSSIVEGVPESCPITVLGEAAFTPPSESPRNLPEVYEQVWFGTPDLWTRIDPAGEVWRGLPVAPDGSVSNRTIWWSQDYSPGDSETITVTAEHLNGSAPPVRVAKPAGGGHNRFDGDFMLVAIELPEPGCWEIAAEYRDATLSYVIWVSGS